MCILFGNRYRIGFISYLDNNYSFIKEGAETRGSGQWHYLDNVYDGAISVINYIMTKK